MFMTNMHADSEDCPCCLQDADLLFVGEIGVLARFAFAERGTGNCEKYALLTEIIIL